LGKVNVGDRAPDFTLQDQNGNTLSLHDFLGSKMLVLYFYPKDFTVGCTAEAKTFSENYEQLQEMGAEVIGVSSDSVETHKDFAGECEVKFRLLADDGGRVRKLYGITPSLGLIPGRVTFVIDKEGVVRRVFSSQLNPRKHVAEAIQELKQARS